MPFELKYSSLNIDQRKRGPIGFIHTLNPILVSLVFLTILGAFDIKVAHNLS